MKNIPWNFQNTYFELSNKLYTKLEPQTYDNPKLIAINHKLATELELNLEKISIEELAKELSGGQNPAYRPYATAYAGHQFGYFNILGDGRAHTIGEHHTKDGSRLDIQLKGSGRTPYSRRGDGLGTLSSMIREYIISEAMHYLKIPTTRSLAVTYTGLPVQRERLFKGGVLTRVLMSNLRVGTFEYAAYLGKPKTLKALTDYAISRHYSHLIENPNRYQLFYREVMIRQIKLICQWMRVGFVHGVMNTDNVSISGETIDYGPCAFMDEFKFDQVFSSIDREGRYAFANQPNIGKWNIAKFGEAILELFADKSNNALDIANSIIDEYDGIFNQEWTRVMGEKFGFVSLEVEDKKIIEEFLEILQTNNLDYTNSFLELEKYLIHGKLTQLDLNSSNGLNKWLTNWQSLLEKYLITQDEAICLMRDSNPVYIPRNHIVDRALKMAELDNYKPLFDLLKVLEKPYLERDALIDYQRLPKEEERVLQTFCGT